MIVIEQGEYYVKTLTLQYADTGEPVNLTGVTAASSIRKNREDETVLANGYCVVYPSTGTIVLEYSQARTAGLPVGECGMDIWIKENGRKHPIYTTRIKVVPPYTDLQQLDS